MKKILFLLHFFALALIANSQSCTPSVSVGASPSGSICQGVSVTFTATPTNGGTPSYQWKKNGGNVGSNSATYSDNGLNNTDNISVVMTSTASCASPTTATSTPIVMTVNPVLTPSVSVGASPTGTICAGSSVTFTATPTNGGTPSYQWKKNGGNVGTNSATYTDNGLNNADNISVVMTSTATCASPVTVNSANSVTMTVLPVLVPSVAIAASPTGPICSANAVTFTATPTNGGTPPNYQWQKNGTNVGTNSATYTNSAWLNNDVVNVIMTSTYQCPSTPTATSTSVTEQVSLSPSNMITPFGPTRFCQGGFVILAGSSTGNALDVNGGRAAAASGAFDVDVNDFTVEGWIYPRALSQAAIVAQGGISSRGFLLQLNADGSLALKTNNGSTTTTIQSASSVVSINKWQHVAASVKRGASGNQTILFLDGDSVAGGNILTTDDLTNAAIEIGGSATAGYNFNGVIDEVRIWNIARSKIDVKGTMSSIIAPTSANLQTYYRFDETTGTTAANSVTGGANATLSGTTAWQTPSSSPVSENSGPSFLYNWSTGSFNQNITATASGTYSLVVTNATNTNCYASGSVSVTVDPLPVASISPSSVAICNGGSTTLTASGGTSYEWRQGSPSGSVIGTSAAITVTPTSTTQYFAIVKNSGGCTSTASRSVTVYSLPTTLPGALPASICNGQSTTLSANASAGSGAISTYAWSSGITGNYPGGSVSPTSNTTYTVTVTNTNTCSATGSVSVTVKAVPGVAPTATLATICSGQSTTLAANATAGSGTITNYAWSSGVSGNSSGGSVSPTSSSNYTVTVTNSNACTATGTDSVTVNANPTVAPTATPAVICIGQSTTLAANATAGSGTISTYAWSSGIAGNSSGGSDSPTANTTYTVTVSNSNSCTANGTVSVSVNTPPVITAGNNGPKCAGSTLNLTSTSGTSYNWSGPNGFTSTQQNPVVSNSTAAASGVYTVTVTANGCTVTATTGATVNALPPATASNNASNTTQCAGETIDLYATGGTSYAWSGPLAFTSALQNPVIINAGALATGTYAVTVTDATTSCSATAATSVTIISVPATASAGLNGPICAGSTLNLSSDGGTSYAWSGPNGFSSAQQDPSITNVTTAATGTYTVTVTNAAGCQATASTAIAVSAMPVITSCPGNMTVNADAGLCSAVVNFAATATGIPAAVITYSKNPGTAFSIGTTTVIVSAANTCGTVTCSFMVTVVDNQLPVFTCPTNITVLATQATCNKTLSIPVPVVTDNCGVAGLVNSFNGTSDASGTYPVGTTNVVWTATDVNGNTSTCTQTVTIAPCVSLSAAAFNTLCPGTFLGSINTTVAGGQAPYSYSWSNGSTTANLTGLSAGAYTVTVTDAASNTISGTFNVGTTIPGAAPAAPGAISGPASFCAAGTYTYSIAAVTYASSYVWTVPTNASVVSGQGTNTVTVQFLSAFTSGTITVYAANCIGNSAAVSLAAAKSQVPKPGAIAGPSSVCPNSVFTYTVGAASGALSYTWTAPANATILTGQGTNTVTVQFGSTYSSGQLKVFASNCAGNSTTVSLTIGLANNVPGNLTVTGATAACPGDVNVYSASPTSNATAFTWTAPANATIVSGQGTNKVSILFQAAYSTGAVKVYGTNCKGNSTVASLTVSLPPVPTSNGGINGMKSVCPSYTYVYTVNAFNNARTYTWSVPANAVILYGQGTTSIAVQFLNGFAGGNLTFYATNCLGNSAVLSFAVNLPGKAPDDPRTVTGLTYACPGKTLTYTAGWANSAISYTWTVPANTTILSGQGSTQITVLFQTGFTGGKVGAYATNCFGNSPYEYVSVALNCSKSLEEPTAISAPDQTPDAGFEAKVYPNPFTNEFRLAIESSSEEAVYVRIFNLTGQLVEERKEVTSGSDINMGNNFAAGVYLIQVKQGDKTKVLRIIKTE